MTNYHVIVADDESPKQESIIEFLHQIFPDVFVTSTKSVRSTIDVLKRVCPDVLILDMSLPTFDVGPGEKGGRPQNFGGEEVLRYMEFYDLSCPVIVVTQYGHFTDNGKTVDLHQVADRLRLEHPNNFREVIHYAGSTSLKWRSDLTKALERR